MEKSANINNQEVASAHSVQNTFIPTEQILHTNGPIDISFVNSTSQKFELPLDMRWLPRKDITVYELALCLPYINRQYPVMPYEIDQREHHFRHFKIINPNSKDA